MDLLFIYSLIHSFSFYMIEVYVLR